MSTTSEHFDSVVPAAADVDAASDAAVDKGLRRGVIGLLGSTVLGVVQTAPAYSIAVTLGFLVAAVGLQAPAALLLGFVPIFCMTIAEREFVAREPDAGTVFVWVGKALGPRLGWLASWALLAATAIALANLANITGTYLFLFVGADGAAGTEWATIAVGCVWLAVSIALGARGVELSSRVQMWLLAAGLAALAVFTVVAFVKVAAGTAGGQALTPSLAWLDPTRISGGGALSSGVLLAIFFYWGWDGPAAVVEESRGGVRTPRLALLLSVVALLGCYIVVTIAMQAYAGGGTSGIGLANEDNSADVLAVVGNAVLGSGLGRLMELTVMLSAAAALTASVLPTARAVLSMGVYRAFPEPFARVDRERGTPVVATVAVGVAVAVTLVVLSIVSNNVLGDSIAALVLLIAFYYTLLGVAAVWFFRAEVGRSAGDLLAKGIAPALGALVLGWALYRNLRDTYAKDYGLTSFFGVGGVFVIGMTTMLIGVVLMVAWNARSPAFFRGETFTREWAERHRAQLARDDV
jgi:amino acid transporter